ncbi:unnamed protein product [Agarophyton chilense]
MLLPTESLDHCVHGFFFDLVQNPSSPPTTNIGRYAYSSGELFKCSRVQGTSPANPTVTISRLILVNRTIFLLDTVVVSFCYPTLTCVPDDILLYSRHLSFHKIATSFPTPSTPDGSFLGLAHFGMYDTLPLPCRIPPGMQRADSTNSFRAVPAHIAICHAPRSMLVGMHQDLLDRLRASFVQLIATDARLSVPMRTVDAFTPSRMNDAPQRRTMSSQHHQPSYVSQSSQPHQLQQQFSFSPQLIPSVDDPMNPAANNPRPYADCRIDIPRIPSDMRAVSSHQPTSQRLISNNGIHDSSTVLPHDIAPSIVHVNPQLVPNSDPDVSLSTAGPDSVHRASHGSQRILPGNGADITPTVRVNEVAAGLPRLSSRVLPANSANTSSNVIFPEATDNAATIVNKPPSEQPVPPFTKTLPAPTKSEIVIRNRISAQRSNEKRRRRIENTKMELAYLKAYLPSLEQRKGCLMEENHSLKLRCIQRYRETDIESFF